MRNRLLLMLSAVIVLPACTQVITSRMGHRYPPRPADCEVVWENMDMAEAATKYETIGSVGIGSLVGSDVETNPDLRERVRAEACNAGADAVLIGANATGGGVFVRTASSGIWLLHQRQGPPPWAGMFASPASAPAAK